MSPRYDQLTECDWCAGWAPRSKMAISTAGASVCAGCREDNESEDVAALRDEVERLRAALTAVVDLRPRNGEDHIESFERIAEDFYLATGMMAPGKDEAAAMNGGVSHEERRAAWDAWVESKWQAARAALNPEESND